MKIASRVDITDFASVILAKTRKGKRNTPQSGSKELLVSCLVLHVSFQRPELSEDEQSKKPKVFTVDGYFLSSISRSLFSGCLAVQEMWKGAHVAEVPFLDQRLDPQYSILGFFFFFFSLNGNLYIRKRLYRSKSWISSGAPGG